MTKKISVEKTLILTIEKELNNIEKFYLNFKKNFNDQQYKYEKNSDWVNIEINKIYLSNYLTFLNNIIERSISLEICLRALKDKLNWRNDL